MPPRVAFDELSIADLTVDAVYEAGAQTTIEGEPLHKLLPGVGNQGGFRAAGSVMRRTVKYAVLFTSGEDPDWPELDHAPPARGVYDHDPGAGAESTPFSVDQR